MKILWGLSLLIVLILGFSLYYYENQDAVDTKDVIVTTEPMAINKAVNEEYKTAQDDEDSVVESNKLLLIAVNNIQQKFKDFQEKQKIDIETTKQAIEDSANRSKDATNDIVNKAISFVNKGLNKTIRGDKVNYKINDSDGSSSQAYVWTKSLRSGTFNEEGEYVLTDDIGLPNTTDNADNYAIEDNQDGDNTANNQPTKKPVYTVPNNSVLSGVLMTGLLGRIPVDGEVIDPFRFTIKINDKSFYANNHSNNILKDVFASGTATGDLLLTCVRASIDSFTFIFEDGTISDHKITDIGTLNDAYGYPCIKGELFTNAAQYIGTSAVLSGLSNAAKAFADAQKTTTNNTNGSSSSQVTGSASKFAAYNALSGGVGSAQGWVSQRAKSSFDVIFVPSGKKIKILTQEQISIDYDPNGRKLNHTLFAGGQNNETLD